MVLIDGQVAWEEDVATDQGGWQHLVLDLDGTLYLGQTPFEFALRFLDLLGRPAAGADTTNSPRSPKRSRPTAIA